MEFDVSTICQVRYTPAEICLFFGPVFMRDPFRPNSNAQLIREAQIGLSLVAILLILFVYVAFYRINGYGRTIPEHVRNSPVAERVWPNSQSDSDRLAQSTESSGFRVGKFLAEQLSVPRNPKTARIKTNVDELNDPATQTAHEEPVPALAVDQPAQRLPSAPDRASVQHSSFDAPLESVVDQKIDNSAKTDIAFTPPAPVGPTINTKIQDINARTQAGVPQTPLEMELQSGPKEQATPVDNSSPTKTDPAAGNNHFLREFPTIIADQPLKSPSVDESYRKFATVAGPNLGGVQPQLHSPRPIHANELRGGDFAVKPAPGLEVNSAPDSTSEFNPEPKQHIAVAGVPIVASKVKDLPSFTTTARSTTETQVPQVVGAAPPTDEQHQLATPIEESPFHLVRTGESFWTIAQLHYDDGRYFRALYKHNELHVTDFDQPIPGTRLETPSVQILVQRWPELCPALESPVSYRHSDQEKNPRLTGTTNQDANPAEPTSIVADHGWPMAASEVGEFYETQSGDTLFGIAAQRLGQASRYLELLRLNESRLPVGVDHLSPLPGKIRLIMP